MYFLVKNVYPLLWFCGWPATYIVAGASLHYDCSINISRLVHDRRLYYPHVIDCLELIIISAILPNLSVSKEFNVKSSVFPYPHHLHWKVCWGHAPSLFTKRTNLNCYDVCKIHIYDYKAEKVHLCILNLEDL